MHLSTYINIINNPNILNNYKKGYAVRVRPNEYFDNEGRRKNTFPKSLTLGKNAFIHFKKNQDWIKYE